MPLQLRSILAIMVVSCVVLLGGCVSDRVSPSFQRTTLDKARSPDENAKLYTDLIRKLINEDRLYAALAHLQEREQQFGRTNQLRLLRADILRKMGNGTEAAAIYKPLLDSRFAGQANHGLGLVYAANDLARGVTYLQRAVDQVPTDARMRNDLGYARLRQGRVVDARVQLATAYQLDEKNQLNRNNYILLLLVQGDQRRAKRIARRSEVTAQTMQDLRDEAQRLAAAASDRPRSTPARGSSPVAAPIAAPQATPKPAPPASQSGVAVSGGVGGGGG